MNERIRELHNQACRLDMEQHPDAIPDGERIQQKFAELIVKECIDWCNANARDDGTAQRIAEDIKKDFGVEE